MWEKRVVLFSKFKGCDEVVTRKETASDEEEWDAKELEATNYIYSALSNKQLEFVCDKDTAYEFMKKLDSLYLRKSTALQIVSRNKLEKLRSKN